MLGLEDHFHIFLGVRSRNPRLFDVSPINQRPTLYKNLAIDLMVCHRHGSLSDTSFVGSQTDDSTHWRETPVNGCHTRHAAREEYNQVLRDDWHALLGVRPRNPWSLCEMSPIDQRPTLYENHTVDLKTCHREGTSFVRKPN